MLDAQKDVRKVEWLRKLDKIFGIMDKLKTRATEQNFEALVGGPDVVDRINFLRSSIRESSEGENRNESDERKQRAVWIEELGEIDPTYEHRKRMARCIAMIRSEIDKGNVDTRGFGMMPAELSADEGSYGDEGPSGNLMAFLGWLARENNEKSGNAAKGYFMAVNDRKKLTQDTLGDDYLTWERLVRENEGYSIFQPVPGNMLYRAFSVAEKIASALQKKVVEEIGLRAEHIREIVALGGPNEQFVLPTEIVNQLNSMQEVQIGPVKDAVLKLMRGWKRWTLLGPHRLLQYILRNFTGDIDPVIAGAPAVLKYAAGIGLHQELWNYYHGDHLAISGRMRLSRNLGVIDASLTAKEIPNIKEFQHFKRLYAEAGKRTLAELPAEYFDMAKKYAEWRESWLRYAAFNYYLDLMKAGKPITQYCAARAHVVESIRRDLGDAEAAAHMSRALLGDYGNLTVMGQWLRKGPIPFFSFQEINLRRYPMLFVNALQTKRVGGMGGAAAMGLYRGLMVSRIAWMYAAMWIWNNFFHRDEEDDLGPNERDNPHIIYGRSSDGTVNMLRNAGALGDFMEWFGLNTLISLYPQYLDGQITGKSLAAAIAKSPMNKIVQGANPFVKGGIEIGMGVSLFPDFANPRSVDRYDAFWGIWGMQDQARGVRGAILKNGLRARPDWVRRMFMGVVDPKQNALHEMHDLRRKFLEKEGVDTSGMYPRSPIATMRHAAMNNDYKAFKEAWKVYLAKGKTWEDYKRSLAHLDPISAKLNASREHRFVNEYLNSIQKKKLVIARDYAREVKVTMWEWWQRARAEK